MGKQESLSDYYQFAKDFDKPILHVKGKLGFWEYDL